jgi:7-carboxy-7-deazaguanine synthase
MRIAEIYRSVQGEGFLTGEPSVFVRASGCNLRCWFCDTPYASWQPEGEDLSVDEIVRQIENCECDHVVITGGEPMLFAELIPLTQHLRDLGRHITIETAGTLNLPVECDLISISPKLSNSAPPAEDNVRGASGSASAALSRQSDRSRLKPVLQHWRRRHEATRHAPEVIRRLIFEYPYQLKFVIDSPADCDEVETYLEEFPEVDRQRVLLMPQGTSLEELAARREWLEPESRRRGFTFCPRRQIEWFGYTRGT